MLVFAVSVALLLSMVIMLQGIGPGAPRCVRCGGKFKHRSDCDAS